MSSLTLVVLGSSAGAGAGLLAGRIGFSVVSVVFYALTVSGVPADAAAHIAVRTSLAAIQPASIVSFVGYWRSGNRRDAFDPNSRRIMHRTQVKGDGRPL